MSLLLDALNKADQERKRNEATPGINSNHGHAGDHNTRTLSITVIAAALIGFVILLAAIYWLGQHSSAAAPVATAAKSSTASLANQAQNTAQTFHNKPSTAAASAPENSVQETITPEDDVASLYAQNAQTPEPVAPAPVTETVATNNNGNTGVQALIPTSITQFANLPDLHDLPSQILVRIPSLNYSEHNYNNVGGSVKINGEIKHSSLIPLCQM